MLHSATGHNSIPLCNIFSSGCNTVHQLSCSISQLLSTVFLNYSQLYFSIIANCISQVWSIVFLKCGQLYFSNMVNSISQIWPTVFLKHDQLYFSNMVNCYRINVTQLLHSLAGHSSSPFSGCNIVHLHQPHHCPPHQPRHRPHHCPRHGVLMLSL